MTVGGLDNVCLVGESIVLKGVELCRERGCDGLVCLRFDNFAQVACRAVGGHVVIGDAV